jgi:hypothetical protein
MMNTLAFLCLLFFLLPQCRRYESQRSPYPSPAAIRHDSPDTNEVSFSEEDNLDTPTNNRRPACILNDDDTRDLLEASLNSSTSSCDSPNHLVPPGSPGLSLKPNRRSVEALKKVLFNQQQCERNHDHLLTIDPSIVPF